MTDIVIAAILALLIGGAAWYVYKEKKRGVKCIGCPMSKSGSCCPSSEGGNCGCGCHSEDIL